MRFNIVKSQLQSFVIRVISTVFRCRRRCRQVIIRARDSSQSGHSCVHRTDASAIERVCELGAPSLAAARACADGAPHLDDLDPLKNEPG